VGKLRSHAAKDVSELAKEIVRTWKTAVDKEKQAAGTHSKGAVKAAGVCANWLISGLTTEFRPIFLSSSTAQSVNRVGGTVGPNDLKQRRSHGKRRRCEHIHHRRQNTRQVYRNAL